MISCIQQEIAHRQSEPSFSASLFHRINHLSLRSCTVWRVALVALWYLPFIRLCILYTYVPAVRRLNHRTGRIVTLRTLHASWLIRWCGSHDINVFGHNTIRSQYSVIQSMRKKALIPMIQVLSGNGASFSLHGLSHRRPFFCPMNHRPNPPLHFLMAKLQLPPVNLTSKRTTRFSGPMKSS